MFFITSGHEPYFGDPVWHLFVWGVPPQNTPKTVMIDGSLYAPLGEERRTLGSASHRHIYDTEVWSSPNPGRFPYTLFSYAWDSTQANAGEWAMPIGLH